MGTYPNIPEATACQSRNKFLWSKAFFAYRNAPKFPAFSIFQRLLPLRCEGRREAAAQDVKFRIS